mmetsp:Transcript_2668/g.3977  ORF Transcript_2668/g.3977 Transcript_2668/m.3977 type:complete len:113 (+) Transcript_2668:986-1324(+)
MRNDERNIQIPQTHSHAQCNGHDAFVHVNDMGTDFKEWWQHMPWQRQRHAVMGVNRIGNQAWNARDWSTVQVGGTLFGGDDVNFVTLFEHLLNCMRGKGSDTIDFGEKGITG